MRPRCATEPPAHMNTRSRRGSHGARRAWGWSAWWIALGLLPSASASPQQAAANAADDADRVRFFLAQTSVPLKDLLVSLATESGWVLDLGGREVPGVLEIARDDRGLTRTELWRSVHE